MMSFDVIRRESSNGFDKHRRVGGQHTRTRPVCSSRRSSKAVVQASLIERRDRLDRTFHFIDSVQRDAVWSGQRGQPDRDRVASGGKYHQAIDRAASAAKLVLPDQPSPESPVYAWLQL